MLPEKVGKVWKVCQNVYSINICFMKLKIKKFSIKKAKEAVKNSSKIEGYKETKNKNVKIKAHKIASILCP